MSTEIVDVPVKIRFCIADHSIMQDGVQGEVKNPEISLHNIAQFKQDIRDLVKDCNTPKAENYGIPDDLSVVFMVFHDGNRWFGVRFKEPGKVYKDSEELIEEAVRILKGTRDGKSHDFDTYRSYLTANKIEL